MRKILNIIALTLNSLVILIILSVIIRNFPSANAIGIIGGADGPTAIYCTSSFSPGVLYGLIILVILLYEIVFIKNLKSKK